VKSKLEVRIDNLQEEMISRNSSEMHSDVKKCLDEMAKTKQVVVDLFLELKSDMTKQRYMTP